MGGGQGTLVQDICFLRGHNMRQPSWEHDSTQVITTHSLNNFQLNLFQAFFDTTQRPRTEQSVVEKPVSNT